MALTLTKTYEDGTILNQADFDAILDDLETFFNTTKITDTYIQADGLSGDVTIADGSITEAKINNTAVTTAKIADETVATSNFNNLAVTTDKIAASNVTTAKIADANVTTGKFAAATLGVSKFAANYAVSSGTGQSSFPLTTTPTTITGLSATITTNGRPVEIRVVPAASGATFFTVAGFEIQLSSTNFIIFDIVRDSTTVASMQINCNVTNASNGTRIHLPALGPFIDTPSAGSYTYSVKASFNNASSTIAGVYMKTFVREL